MKVKIRQVAVGVTGASGAIYAKILLEKLVAINPKPEIALVMSDNARTVWEHELGTTSYDDFNVERFHRQDFAAPFASGSSSYETLIIIPCSMGTLGRIANGTSDDLITRAADVMLKERRRLILVPRDAPLGLIQLRNMVTVAEAGAVVCPAMPSFYSKPDNLNELAATVVDRVLGLAGFDIDSYRWGQQD